MLKHFKQKTTHNLVFYGTKNNGDFVTSLDSNVKVNEIINGDYTFVDLWEEINSGDLYYKVGNKCYTPNEYTAILYDLFRVKHNFEIDCYLPTATI